MELLKSNICLPRKNQEQKTSTQQKHHTQSSELKINCIPGQLTTFQVYPGMCASDYQNCQTGKYK